MNKDNMSEGTDTASIRQLIAFAEKHQNNIESFIPLHTEDVIIVNIAGRRVIGKEAFHEAMKKALASSLANVLTRIEIKAINFISSDAAIISCIKTVLDERDHSDSSNAKLPSSGSLTYVVVRDGGPWRIALAQTTPIKQ